MSRILRAVLILWIATVGTAIAQDAPRVDPALRVLMRTDAELALIQPELAPVPLAVTPLRSLEDAESAIPSGVGTPGGIALEWPEPGGEPRVGLLVELRPPYSSALDALRHAGAEIGTVIGEIATVRAPLSTLPALARLSTLERIEAARVRVIQNDVGVSTIRANQLRFQQDGIWLGTAGYDVIVGIYDTGIDYRHPDFSHPGGGSRILEIWDQTQQGQPPAGFSYGHRCDAASIVETSCTQQDRAGHGSHVAGAAAGNGAAFSSSGTPYRFAGVAPAADLIVVKGGDTSFSDERIVDGIAWIFQRAEALGRPAVVNLSLGGQYGPRDGTSLIERALDALSGPGRIITVAAGNDGDNANTNPLLPSSRIHGTHTAVLGESVDFSIRIPDYEPNSGSCNDDVWIELWSPGEDRLELTVIRPNGSSLTAPHGSIRSHDDAGGQIVIFNAEEGPDPRNGDYSSLIRISDCGASGPPRNGTWTLRVTPTTAASGRPYHFWISPSRLGPRTAQAVGIGPGFTNSHLISTPATARDVVTVGAFVTQHCWDALAGTFCWQSREKVGDIAVFSSPGPTRDGRLKPEIAAPGRTIISTLSRHSDAARELTSADGAHVVMQGTSMATPFVTGTIALMLQLDPTLAPDEIKSILAASAIQDAFTANSYAGEPTGSPNNQWGHGKLNAQSAVGAIETPTPATLVAEAHAYPAPSTTSSRQGTRLPLVRVSLHTIGAEPVRLLSLGVTALGDDADARLLLVHDVDGDGEPGGNEPVVAQLRATLRASEPGEALFVPAPITLSPTDTLDLIAVVELSGNAPNASAFQLVYEPELLRAVGLLSGQATPIQQAGTPVASPTVVTDLLEPGEDFALSENPVRSDRVVFNFRVRPRVAGIYTVTGSRVVDLLPRLDGDHRVEWDLTNDRGSVVAPGVYLAVFDIGGTLFREKLFVVRPSGTQEE